MINPKDAGFLIVPQNTGHMQKSTLIETQLQNCDSINNTAFHTLIISSHRMVETKQEPQIQSW